MTDEFEQRSALLSPTKRALLERMRKGVPSPLVELRQLEIALHPGHARHLIARLPDERPPLGHAEHFGQRDTVTLLLLPMVALVLMARTPRDGGQSAASTMAFSGNSSSSSQ